MFICLHHLPCLMAISSLSAFCSLIVPMFHIGPFVVIFSPFFPPSYITFLCKALLVLHLKL